MWFHSNPPRVDAAVPLAAHLGSADREHRFPWTKARFNSSKYQTGHLDRSLHRRHVAHEEALRHELHRTSLAWVFESSPLVAPRRLGVLVVVARGRSQRLLRLRRNQLRRPAN